MTRKFTQFTRFSPRFIAAFSLALLTLGATPALASATGTIGCNQVQTQTQNG